MATIAENLLALQETKDNFKTSFESKGVDLTDVPFTEYPNKLEDLKEDLDTELTEQETLLNELEEDVNALSDKDDTALKLLDGTLEEFDNTQWGLTAIRRNQFYGFSNLGKVTLKDVDTIGEYAFYEAGENVENPDFEVTLNNCWLGTSSFQGSAVKKISGSIRNFAGYSFNSLSHCTEIDISLKNTTSIGSSNIYRIPFLQKIKIDVEGCTAKALGSGFCCGIGYLRQNSANNILEIDLRKGVFTSIQSTCFTGSSITDKNKYIRVYLPQTLTEIKASAFNLIDHNWIYFTSTTVPTLHSSAFSTVTNSKIYVPYSLINAYKTATNWVTHADYIYGWAEENTFAQDAVLPTTNDEGLTLTWYSDEELTIPVTSVTDPSKIYYCVGV